MKRQERNAVFKIVESMWRQKGWLMSYLAQRVKLEIGPQVFRHIDPPIDFIISIANHFEPKASTIGIKAASAAVKKWCKDHESIPTRDFDGSPFKHTYYFPAEQYAYELIAPLEEHCRKNFGEVEVHLHHGIVEPDNADNLRRQLQEFVGNLRRHGFLSYDISDINRNPRYCFVHGNWALANSAKGKFCGVDNEMEILAETGCYMDCTLPSAPFITQVRKINSIYECGFQLNQAVPHRDGRDLAVGDAEPKFPFLMQGPLVVYWKRGKVMKRIGFPSIENGAIHDSRPPSIKRFWLWASSNVHIKGRPNWIFIKLHTHSLQNDHLNSARGPVMKRFLEDLERKFNDGIRYRLHFTTSRESANIIMAAINGKTGNPNEYRNYRFNRFDR